MKFRLFIAIILVVLFLLTGNSFAATYYVATTGDNAAPGTEGEPWRTLKYAADNISNGDTVIVRGGTYHENFRIIKSNITFQAYTAETPIIDGNGVLPVDPEGTGYYALIAVYESGADLANNVTIDGFTVRRSTGYGINVYDPWPPSDGSDGVTIKNCEIYQNYNNAVVIGGGAERALIEDCEIYTNCMCMVGGYSGEQALCTGGQRPSQVTLRGDDSIMRRCTVRDSYNEGLNIERYSDNITVEYCQIYGNFQLQLYAVNTTNPTIRYNLIYGTNPNANGWDGTGEGIYFGNEAQWSQPNVYMNAKVYGNLVANTSNNMWIDGAADTLIHNVFMYNNTLIEATINAFRVEGTTGSGHIFKNNIIWQTDGVIATVPAGKVTADYNLWSRVPDVDVQGANDPTYAVPLTSKTTGWTTLTGGSLDGGEFSLGSASTAVDAGKSLDTVYSKIPDCNVSVWSGAVKLRNQTDQGSGWEIGADVHVVDGTSEGEIKEPKTLTIKTSSE